MTKRSIIRRLGRRVRARACWRPALRRPSRRRDRALRTAGRSAYGCRGAGVTSAGWMGPGSCSRPPRDSRPMPAGWRDLAERGAIAGLHHRRHPQVLDDPLLPCAARTSLDVRDEATAERRIRRMSCAAAGGCCGQRRAAGSDRCASSCPPALEERDATSRDIGYWHLGLGERSSAYSHRLTDVLFGRLASASGGFPRIPSMRIGSFRTFCASAVAPDGLLPRGTTRCGAHRRAAVLDLAAVKVVGVSGVPSRRRIAPGVPGASLNALDVAGSSLFR